MDEKMEEIGLLAKPLVDYLETNYNPHCAVVINGDGIKIVNSIMFIPKTKTS